MEKTEKVRKGNSGEKLYKAFIYIVLILLAVSIVVPVAWVFMASIKQNSEFYGNPWSLPLGFYWQNFVDAWETAKMGDYMLNSVFVTALSLLILLVVALPASYCLSRFKFVGSKFLNTAFMAGLFINVNYIVVPIFLMLRDGDTWLKSVFGSGFLLNNLVVLSIVYAATALPFTIYLLSGYFATLAHDYEEAAYIDGAGYGRTMVSIIFPMAQPSIVTIILFNFLSFWNEYIISMTLMSSATGAKTLPVGLLNLMQAPDPLYLRAEEAHPGHDRRRTERLRCGYEILERTYGAQVPADTHLHRCGSRHGHLWLEHDREDGRAHHYDSRRHPSADCAAGLQQALRGPQDS